MPELPEVETTLRGVRPLVSGQKILELVLRTDKLRFPLDPELCRILPGQTIRKVSRRAKYLLFECDRGTLILHLGMSGSLRVIPADTTENKHDHLDLVLHNGECLRFTDPRKFGTFLYTEDDPGGHRLLKSLGPEPLSEEFDADRLFAGSRNRTLAVKPFLMDQKIVVGVGNIYANEALYRAGIRPTRSAGKISLQRYRDLVEAIKTVLNEAIAAGGTTISDFRQYDGRPGYFKQKLQVYGRAAAPCDRCGAPIASLRVAQRSTYYCPRCQS